MICDRIDSFEDVAPMVNMREEIIRQVTAIPPKSRKAADLTDRDKTALALAAGASYRTEMIGTMLHFHIDNLVGFSDRPEGGWFVMIGPKR
jgi:hypothetical protein